MNEKRQLPIGTIILLGLPIVVLATAFFILSRIEMTVARWERYREFWGGNPSEVYSHWLDMVFMSGNAIALAWFLVIECFSRRGETDSKWLPRITHAFAGLSILLSGVIGVVLDGLHGEGTVQLVYPVLFLPMLASSYYLLRKIAVRVQWRIRSVIGLAGGFAILHVIAQLFYEPSGNGGPNLLIIPLWLSSIAAASVWGFVRSIQTGRLQRFFAFTGRAIRKPVAWIGVPLVVAAIVVPLTIHASQLRKPHEQAAMKWLDDLETKLTDAFVADLKRDHAPARIEPDSKVPISENAHALLADARIKAGNWLRIYIPLERSEYLFIQANSHFEYGDIRRLRGDHTEEIDQRFIDTVISRNGTHQTGLYSILWSDYKAGRVLKDKRGDVKAICIINMPSH